MPDLDRYRELTDRAGQGRLTRPELAEYRTLRLEMRRWWRRCDPAPEECVLCGRATPDVATTGGEPGPVCGSCWARGKRDRSSGFDRNECAGK